jgi:hypothetical protein
MDSFERTWLITVIEKTGAKARPNVEFDYWTMMNNNGILAIITRDIEWLRSDVTEDKMHTNVMNWECRFSLSKTHNGVYTLVILLCTITLYCDSVDGSRDHITYQKLVTL